MESDVLVIYA